MTRQTVIAVDQNIIDGQRRGGYTIAPFRPDPERLKVAHQIAVRCILSSKDVYYLLEAADDDEALVWEALELIAPAGVDGEMLQRYAHSYISLTMKERMRQGH